MFAGRDPLRNGYESVGRDAAPAAARRLLVDPPRT